MLRNSFPLKIPAGKVWAQTIQQQIVYQIETTAVWLEQEFFKVF